MSKYNRAKSSNTLTLQNWNKDKNVKIEKKKEKDISNLKKQDRINETIFELMSLKEGLEENKKKREEIENMIYENNEKIVKLYDTYERKKSDTCCNNVELNTSKFEEEKNKIDDNNEDLNDKLFNLKYERTKIMISLKKEKDKLDKLGKPAGIIEYLSLGGKKKKRKTKKNKVRKNKTKRKNH